MAAGDQFLKTDVVDRFGHLHSARLVLFGSLGI
jgi:hypothetical protein